MTYEIQPYTYKKAKELGVFVQPSQRSNYKIDVFNKKEEYMFSGGARGYGDYPTFLKEKGKDKQFADERRRLYKIRHSKDRKIINSNGWFADKLLW